MSISSLIGFLALVGAITILALAVITLWYIITRKPTPNATIKEAVTSLRWSYGIGFFIVLPTLAGFQEGIPVTGFLTGVAFIFYIILLQWWIGPI